MNTYQAFISAVVLSLLVGCGGGGGGDDGSVPFSGTWTGEMAVASNSCSGTTPGGYGTFVVTQDGTQVVLAVNALTFDGSTTGANSFVVTDERSTLCDGLQGSAQVPTQWIESITFSNVGTTSADVTFDEVNNGCPNSPVHPYAACETVFQGTFTRAQ
jgi:hypothetical protein